MNNIQQRDYYKIFTGTNQTDGYDKIHLGYEAQTSEITLKKDDTTFFHVPFFASVQNLNDSSLAADGAIPGPIPALADRIYKKLGGYGNTTPWGSPSEREDGTWLCSWLYALSSETPKWFDRYYNPGRIAYNEALEGTANVGDYVKHDPVYYDVPSTLTLEPGVYYQYFHNGRNTAVSAVETFAGQDKSRLKLNIDDWSANILDKSIYNNTITINNFKPYWVTSISDPGYSDRSVLSFENKDFINCSVQFNEIYNLKNEFTTSFWIYNDDWSMATNTQLLGNLRKTGYGIFYNNLNNNPFFVIPETKYGHFFLFNQEGDLYTEKNVEILLGYEASPIVVNINSNSEIVSLDANNLRLIKYNHLGDVIAYTKTPTGNNATIEGTPKLSILDGDDNTTVVTTSGIYVYDNNLILKTAVPYSLSAYRTNEQLAYNTKGELIREICNDIKFDSYNNKWTVKNNVVYLNGSSFFTPLDFNTNIPVPATNVAIDPNGDIWILAGANQVTVFDKDTLLPIKNFELGVLYTTNSHLNITPYNKNISFIQTYDRNTNTFTWYALIYYDYEKNLYQITLDGDIYKNTYLPPKLNILDPATALQNKNLLSFNSKGDFTGYEQRRIFNKLKYNNNAQIQFKASVKNSNTRLPNSIYTLSIPINYLVNQIWHLVTVTVKNNTVNIFIDNYLRDTLTLPGNVDLNYDSQHNFYIGTSSGKTENLNVETNSKAIIWNGKIDTVRIYDYAIDNSFIQYFVREKINATDITWNIPTAALQYVEIIDQFFKHRLPGAKSTFFNIRLAGAKITDISTRKRIENDIKQAIEQIKPVYTELLHIEWID